jgi:hypothetical protein
MRVWDAAILYAEAFRSRSSWTVAVGVAAFSPPTETALPAGRRNRAAHGSRTLSIELAVAQAAHEVTSIIPAAGVVF